jgi:hypothetical protein
MLSGNGYQRGIFCGYKGRMEDRQRQKKVMLPGKNLMCMMWWLVSYSKVAEICLHTFCTHRGESPDFIQESRIGALHQNTTQVWKGDHSLPRSIREIQISPSWDLTTDGPSDALISIFLLSQEKYISRPSCFHSPHAVYGLYVMQARLKPL